MAIDETGLTKGLVRKLNALRKSVGGDLAEEVFARWLEREAASQAKSKPDPVAMKIVEALAGFENASFELDDDSDEGSPHLHGLTECLPTKTYGIRSVRPWNPPSGG